MKLTVSPAVKILNHPGVRDYYVCGDIHGMVSLLYAKLNSLGFDPSMDRLVCTGDIVDRGSQSIQAVLLLKEDWFESVCGNNEDMVLRALADRRHITYHLKNGGRWLYDLDPEEIKLVESLLKDLPYAIEIHHQGAKYGVVHADVMGNNWNNFKDQLLGKRSLLSFLYCSSTRRDIYQHTIWSRDRFMEAHANLSAIRGVDAVFAGHNITPRPIHRKNMFYIDTGAFMSHKLTVLKLDPKCLECIPSISIF